MLESLGSIFTIALYTVFGFAFLSTGIKVIPQATQANIERFGKYSRTQKAGITFIIPFVERIAYRVSMKEDVIDLDPQPCITQDNAQVEANAVVFFRPVDAYKAVYEVEDFTQSISELTLATLRSLVGEKALDEVLANRAEINSQILSTISETAESYGIKIQRVEVTEVTPDKTLLASMAEQVKSERERRSTLLTAKAQREAAIEIAEGEKEATKLRSEGLLIEARNEAEAIERRGEAEAKANKLLSDSLENGNRDAINYYLGQSYIETLGKIGESSNSKLVLMPLESSNVIGSIGGISELLNTVSKK
ncbi:SPFH domain-containing protein [Vibrio mediterranei]|uniref:SPFH domain-containing protein n=1 Tax=Vibrio mediterranei TaxID=689 RepID=UPI004067A423